MPVLDRQVDLVRELQRSMDPRVAEPSCPRCEAKLMLLRIEGGPPYARCATGHKFAVEGVATVRGRVLRLGEQFP